jgi:hypothetical protein
VGELVADPSVRSAVERALASKPSGGLSRSPPISLTYLLFQYGTCTCVCVL